MRPIMILCFILLAWMPASPAQETNTFYPLPSTAKGENWESHTGLWVCPNLGTFKTALPLPVRLHATKESVTGGAAVRADIRKGATVILTYENGAFQAGTAGMTLYAKASDPVECNIRNNPRFSVTTEWTKIDIPWQKFGADPAKPAIGWQFDIRLTKPAEKDMWIIFDRIGTEGPAFIEKPPIKIEEGPDETINTKDIVGNAAALAPTIEKLKNKKPFKIVAFGDSITAGAQMSRGSWGIKGKDAVSMLYFGHLARLLNKRYGYDGVGHVQKGYGGWTSEKARSIVKQKVLPSIEAGDLAIIQFGGNDMSWAKISADDWLKYLAELIAAVRTKTDQVMIVSCTTWTGLHEKADEISRKFRAFAIEQKVAYADITAWSVYRGKALSWGYLANQAHPDFMGHIMMAELMEPLFGAPHFNWPQYVGKAGKAAPAKP